MTDATAKPCVLVCEDEMYVAMMLQDRLEDSGYRVVTAARISEALALAEAESINVALLDINMAGEDSFSVAERLRSRGIPFLFSSGYGEEILPVEWRSEQVLRKPYDTRTVTTALAEKLA